MDKIFISADELLMDAFKLAEAIYSSQYRPDYIVGVWRGGTPVAIAVQEFLEYKGVKTEHTAIQTSSYFDIDKQHDEIRVSGIDHLVDNIAHVKKLLIIDDVFDSGRSVKAILNTLSEKKGYSLPGDIKIACPWYKPTRNSTDIVPDFYLYTTDKWLVFPHELMHLSLEEIANGKGKGISDLLKEN